MFANVCRCLQGKNTHTMAIFSLYLDTRSVKDGKPAPIKIRFTKQRKTAYIPTELSVTAEQWDSSSQTVFNHPRARLYNAQLNALLLDAENEYRGNRAIYGALPASVVVKKIRSIVFYEEQKPQDFFLPHFMSVIEKKDKERTKDIYRATLLRMKAFCDVEELCFSHITPEWLRTFDKFLSQTSPSANARAIHFRNIRAVFNDAIDEEVTTLYPFRKFKIKKEETVKRSLTVEQLAKLFTAEVKEEEQKYIDIMKLIFYLIGINIIDLCNLKSIENGYIHYHRAKTNRLYSIKVEPEALELIKKYKGEKHLIYINDHYTDYKHFNRLLALAIQRIGKKLDKRGDKTFQSVTSYWMRHTWATIAAELDIPKETIAAALGHGGNDVTDIYIRFDKKKIDKANRQVIDYVNEAMKRVKGRE